MAVTHVRHDSFARASLHRETRHTGECSWCGRKPERARPLYGYAPERDDQSCARALSNPFSADIHRRSFCDVNCYSAFVN